MLKNVFGKLLNDSINKSKLTSFEKRAILLDQVMMEQTNPRYNPRTARNKSMKGIIFSNNK